MWHERARVAGVSLLALGVLAGCGRDSLSRSSCTDDSDCLGGQICAAGICIDEGQDLPVADLGPDQPVDPDMPIDPDMPPDMPPVMCDDVVDCPGQGGPVTEGSRCVTFTCGEELGLCVVSGQVPVMCAPYEVQQGCECGTIMCESAADCADGFGCVRGQCAPCIDSNSCDGQVCGEDGRCTGCSSEEDCRADQVCDAGQCVTRPQCVVDSQCGPQEICLAGRCTYSPECTVDEDCREGYECVGDRCFEELCRGPQDCPEGQLCDAGRCVDQPQDVLSCFVATRSATVVPGQTVQLEAFALDMQGRGVAASFSWTSSAPGVMAVNGSNAVAGNTAGQASVKAALANGMPIQCTGEAVFTNLGQPNPGTGLRVLVIHAESGAPIPNAEVVVRVGNGMTQTAMSGPTGLATLPSNMGQPYEVSVFSNDFNYITVQGVRSSDIRLPLNPRSGTGPVAGFTGQFDLSRITSTGDFNLGLAGASLAGGLVNLDLTKLLGDPFVQRLPIPIPGGGGPSDIPLPGGLVVYGRVFGLNIQLKREYQVQSAGGARLGWGLAGKVPVNELISLFQGGSFDDIGDVLTLILPLFSRFDHALQPLNLAELPRITDATDFDGDGDRNELLPDYAAFPKVSLLPSVRQQLITSINVSSFPQFAGGPGEAAIIVGGAQLQASGFVPMGISATADDDGDGRPDARLLTMAPPYGSAVGGRFAVLAIAFRTDSFQGPGQGGGLELPDELSFALWNGQSLPNSIQLGTFPSASQGIINPQSRQLSINAKAGPLYRARFVGASRSWDVWSAGPAGVGGQFMHTITVPSVPAGREDLFQNTKLLLDAIRSQVAIDDLTRTTGVLLTDVTLVSTGFNRTRLRD